MGSSHNASGSTVARVAVIDSIEEVRRALAEHRRRGASIGLVPTMGALHRGHGALIERAARDTDLAVVSIFVNPIQFNDPGDFKQYPRTLDADTAYCESSRARVVFAPSAQEMYPEPSKSFVDVEGVSEHLCGKFRPGHFRGVATVVLKLLQIVQPDQAYFGEKDAQQLAVIRRMVRDLNVPVKIASVPTVREPDGLALSSRNQRLTPGERSLAPLLYRALQLAEKRIGEGVRDPEAVKREALDALRRPEIQVEYLEFVDPGSVQPVGRIEGSVLVAAAIWIGGTRLIDNVLWTGA
jgi:pantoate--beta-alanine ligase